MRTFTLHLKLFITLGICLGLNAQTFEYKDTGTSFILFDLSIPPESSETAYAVGSKYTVDSEGIIIKTTDGGETWETIYPTEGTAPSFEKIEFINENTGFVVGYNLALKTENGGVTWEEITVGTDVYLYNNLTFYDENTGVITAQLNGSPYFGIYLTSDGGNTWTPSTNVNNAGGIAIDYADENTVFSVGNNEVISKSTDGGNTWEYLNQTTSGLYNIEVFFKDTDNGFVAGDDGKLMITHDSGETWNSFSTGYHNFYALYYKGEKLIAAGTDEDIYISEDNGETWNILFNGSGGSTFHGIDLFADDSGLICGSGGKMVKFQDVFMSTSENDLIKNNVMGYYNSNTGIYTVYSKNSTINNIVIFNTAGQMMNSFKVNSMNIHTNISAYPSGVYFIKVTTEGGKTFNLKLIKK